MFSSMEQAYIVSCVYVLQVFNNDGVLSELCGNVCLLDLAMWCDVGSYSLWHFVLEEG